MSCSKQINIPQVYQEEKYYNYIVGVHFRKALYKSAKLQMFKGARDALTGAKKTAEVLEENIPKFAAAAESAEGAATAVQAAAGAAKTAIDEIGLTAAQAKSTLSNADNVLQKLQAAMTPVQILWGEINLFPTLLKIARILINLSFARSGCMLASFLLNVCSEFGTQVVELIKSWLFSSETIQLNPTYRAAQQQGILDDLTPMLEVRSFLAKNTALTVTAVAVSIFGIMQCALGLPKMEIGTERMLKFFGERCKHLKSMADFAKSTWNMFTDVAEWLIESIFPGMIKHRLDEYIVGYQKWHLEVMSLIGHEKGTVHERVKKEKGLVYDIMRLYKKGMEFSKNLMTLKVEAELVDHFQKTFALCKEFLKQADHGGALGNKPRVKPYIIHLFGESGVGKSGMLWPLCSDLNASMCKTREEAKDLASEIYFRSCEQEFWDGYGGQRITVYDDFGQKTDSSSAPNEEYFEIIRAGNPAPYSLHMATLEDKANSKFISQFVVLTSNQINQSISSLTHPTAVRRRIDVLGKVTIKEEYSKKGINLDNNAEFRMLDPTKCAGGADTRVYEITLYDAMTHQPIKNAEGESITLDYEAFVRHCLAGAGVNFNQSLNFNESLEQRMTQERFEELSNAMRMTPLPTAPEARPATAQMFRGPDDVPRSPSEEELIPKRMLCEEGIRRKHIRFYGSIMPDQGELEFIAQVEGEVPVEEFIPIPPPKTSWLVEWRRRAKGFLTLKSALTAVGVLLGGFGIWALFKWNREDEKSSTRTEDFLPLGSEEGAVSGDNKTRYFRRGITEACASGDNRTVHMKKARAEIYDEIRKSKSISRALRHELISDDGYVPMTELLEHLKSKGVSREDVVHCVAFDPKQRFEYNVPEDKIRAVQGHSYEIDPSKLYERCEIAEATHFTYGSRVPLIEKNGIRKMQRAFVHLHPGHLTTPPKELPNRNTALWVDLTGLEVWKTNNGYLLVKEVPKENIKAKKTITARQEACCSADNRTKHLRKGRVEGPTPARLEAWQDKTAQDLITNRLMGNLYQISVDGRAKLNGIFVRDTCMLTVEHLIPVLKNGTSITIRNVFDAEFTVPISSLEYVPIRDSAGNSKDAMIIKFPRHIPCHADIVKHFQLEPELSAKRANVCLPVFRTLSGVSMFGILGNADCKIEHAKLQLEDKQLDIRDSLQYSLNTTYGDCGSPVVVNDNSFIRKIAGIHVAAYDDGSSAIGQSVTQKDITKHIYDLKPLVVDPDELPNITLKPAQLQLEVFKTFEEIRQDLDMPAPTFGYYGTCSKVSSPPPQTDIRKSAIHGYVEPTTKPAYLWHPTINLVHKNMEKCAVNCPYIPQEEIDQAVGEVKSLLLSGKSRTRLARILTYEEAVSGSPISDYIDGLNRRSSPGYPFVFDKKPEFPGKTTWFGKDEWVFDEDIREICEERIRRGKLGERCPTVWSDTLKDERRPIEKVNALKTRVFSHGPMDYTIVFRMYFLGFIAHIMENRIQNEQSIGTNPFGMDWKLTAKKLSRFGHRVFAGDFSQFDGTLNSCIMKEFASVANQFYNDGEENARLREVLMLDVFNSVHLCSGKYIQLTHSQPSGNPLTTILNSFYNSVSMRIAYYRCFDSKAPAFRDNVSMVSYGDDNVVNFSETVAEKFNQNTVTRAYASFGMIYTDESKSNGEIADWRTLSEVNYLKRGFRLEHGEWRAPLALETILEGCNWIRKCPDAQEACVMNCEANFRELAQHEPAVFKEKVELIARALYEKTNHFPEIKTRLMYLEDDDPSW